MAKKDQNPQQVKTDTEQQLEQESHEGLEFPSRKQLEDQLTAMEIKMDEYKNQSIRAQAELENVRRRAERDITNAHKYGSEKLLADLLPVMDSMVRGLESSESKDPHAKAMRDGLVITLEIFQKTLEKHGVELIDPKPGEAFNPEFHEAMSTISDPDAKANTIYEVVQKGFQLNGRVLRAAMVVVVSGS